MIIEGRHPAGIDLLSVPMINRRRGLDPVTLAPMHDHAVVGFNAHNTLSNGQDGGRTFMAQKVRQEFIRTLGPLDFIELRSADPAVMDTDQDLSKNQPFMKLYFG